MNDFNKCQQELGNTDFLEFHVVEVMEGSTKEERNKREEWWIAQHYDEQKLCYNFKQKTGGKERTCFSHTPVQTKEKQSKRSKAFWQDPDYLAKNPCGSSEEKRERMLRQWADPERREKMLSTVRNNAKNPEILAAISKRSEKTYPGFVSPEGVVFSPVTNLRQFALQHGLLPSCLDSVAHDRVKTHKGWKKFVEINS